MLVAGEDTSYWLVRTPTREVDKKIVLTPDDTTMLVEIRNQLPGRRTTLP